MSHFLLNVLKVKWSLFVLFALISLSGFGQKPIFTDEVNLQYSNGISSEFIRRSSGF
ncbi:hypothetical protein [Phaeocystidibacter marisrubri]|uniref:hypothetical protein n=1 Tax=Phaeocystidibacter marisrubri TaxID=1577780 RepID=UPI0014789F99|nr:hypothetical protein [Phaeocystidibacter marisrubri]